MTDNPELEGYVPDDGEGERRWRRRRRTLSLVGLVVLIAMLVPSVSGMLSQGDRAAKLACAEYVTEYARAGSEPVTRFQLFGPGVFGWECYASNGQGEERHLVSFGLMPSGPSESGRPTQQV